ncbi:MAG: hypothetical protein KDA53_14805 [Hyphomonas sp.]|nr:hypothetical protein [Hyphomonas sp.]
MLLRPAALIALGVLTLGACQMPPAEEAAEAAPAPVLDLDNKLQVGQLIAETRCSRCHATGRGDRSPHDEAKPFREFSENYPIRDLEEPLAEGIMVGHPDMPVFQLSPYEIDALLSYMESIQKPHPT